MSPRADRACCPPCGELPPSDRKPRTLYTGKARRCPVVLGGEWAGPTMTTAAPTIRPATAEDIPVLRELFEAGVFEGQVRINDTGADIEQLDEGYFGDEGLSGFWVATENGEVAGMIGVQRVDSSVAEVRRLRIRPQYRRRGIATALMAHAIGFCRERDYLKIVLDVRVERQGAISLFEKFGFYLSRIRDHDDRKMLDFYVDLYSEPQRP